MYLRSGVVFIYRRFVYFAVRQARNFTYSTHVSNLIRYIIQVGVLHGLTSRDSFRRITPEHFIEEVQTLLVEIGHKRVQWSDWMSSHLCFMLLVQWQFCESRPFFKGGCASNLEDFVELVSVVLPGEQGRPVDNLSKDATNWPYIDWCGIVFGAK